MMSVGNVQPLAAIHAAIPYLLQPGSSFGEVTPGHTYRNSGPVPPKRYFRSIKPSPVPDQLAAIMYPSSCNATSPRYGVESALPSPLKRHPYFLPREYSSPESPQYLCIHPWRSTLPLLLATITTSSLFF